MHNPLHEAYEIRLVLSTYNSKNKYSQYLYNVKCLMRATQDLIPLTDEGPGGCPPGPHVYCCVLLVSVSTV